MKGKKKKRGKVGATRKKCPPKVLHARWDETPVKCGDDATMQADTKHIPASTAATFTVKRISDGGTITTENSETEASSFQGSWVSQKPSRNWNGAEVKFTAAAAGVQADSEDPQLSFHKYPDTPQGSLTGSMESPPGAPNPKFGWRKMLFIELKDRKLVMTVKVHLINRTQPRPDRGKKEAYPDYRKRCDTVPVGGTIDAAAKTAIKNTVEVVYKDKRNLHRQDCQRGNGCNCPRENLCCKFPIEVHLDLVDVPGPMVHEVNLWPGTAGANSNNWFRIESRPGKSWAHETGHLLGFYDEYPEGAIGPPPWKANAPSSIMGDGTNVEKYHVEEFRNWLSAEIDEEFELI